MNRRIVTTIGNIAKQIDAGFACSKARLVQDGIPHLRPFNITRDGQIDFSTVFHIDPSEVPRNRGTISSGDILFNNTNSDDLVGKTAFIRDDMTAAFSNHMTRIAVDRSKADPAYVAYSLDHLWQIGHFRRICTRWVSQAAVNLRALSGVEIALPSLPEQRSIVDILDRAASIRRLRQQAQDTARFIIPALFNKMFGDPLSNSRKWAVAPLGTVSEVSSGVTKGRKLDAADIVDVPYLRVANVQDGRLELEDMKQIPIKRSEIERFRLMPGDLLMTEGGDPDKLGRGALWSGELPYCAHQNHVFRVRANRQQVLPSYLATLTASAYGKAYFLRVAKRTTGIASINKSQLSAFPVPVPPIPLQERFNCLFQLVENVTKAQTSVEKYGTGAIAAIEARLLG